MRPGFVRQRGHEFTVDLPGEGTYIIKLLEGVQIEKSNDAAIGRWPAFDQEATGDSEDDVYEKLVGSLSQKTGAPGSPEFEPFAAYVREHGTRLSEEAAAARTRGQLREITRRVHELGAVQW